MPVAQHMAGAVEAGAVAGDTPAMVGDAGGVDGASVSVSVGDSPGILFGRCTRIPTGAIRIGDILTTILRTTWIRTLTRAAANDSGAVRTPACKCTVARTI